MDAETEIMTALAEKILLANIAAGLHSLTHHGHYDPEATVARAVAMATKLRVQSDVAASRVRNGTAY